MAHMGGPQEWKNSGSDCCSPLDLCCLSWWCPCFVHGKIHHRLHKDGNLQGYSTFNMDCCAWYCLAHIGCHWIVQMMQRSELRRKYNLKGDGCTDCLCAYCCTPCDLTQQEKEAEFREKERLMGGAQIQAVQIQPAKMDNGMQYQPQQQQQHYQQQPQMGYQQPQQYQQQHPQAMQPVYHQ